MCKTLKITWIEFLLPLSLWFIGCMVIFLIVPGSFSGIENLPIEDFTLEKTLIDALLIFFNNIILGLLLTFLGYFTFGLFSLFASLWNGLILGSIIHDFLQIYSITDLISGFYHVPIEIIGLSLFAAMGMKNFCK